MKPTKRVNRKALFVGIARRRDVVSPYRAAC
jgi:hypothetical protein